MITFRSNWFENLSAVLLAVGLFGFFGCWFVAVAADWRLDAHPEYSKPSASRPAEIRTKFHTGYVERAYAERLTRTDRWSAAFWLIATPGALGIALVKAKK
jgi:hypothetical protein